MDLNYYGLSLWQKILVRLKLFFVGFGKGFCNFWVRIAKGIARFFKGLFGIIRDYFVNFFRGNGITKTSYLIMGFGHFTRGQIIRGLMYLFIEVVYFAYLFLFNGQAYMLRFFISIFSANHKFGSFPKTDAWSDAYGAYITVYDGDNSFLFLLYGLVAILLTAAFVVVYMASVRESYKIEQMRIIGKKPNTFKEDMKDLFDKKFHITLLAIPLLGVVIFTIVPLIAMILIAFTNYDQNTPLLTTLFEWVGFDNFQALFSSFGQKSGFGYTFIQVLIWTVIWAFFATFTNYFAGMLLAMLINKKGIKLKKLYRTLFIATIAVPQFVSLLIMSTMLVSSDGVDTQNIGIITRLIYNVTGGKFFFNFSNNYIHTRIGVIIVNMWIGIPYTMLMCSGILMNIPADLYESARIDGASPARRFMKITLPYMLFVTGPYLITQFIGNLNNFNVIYLLCGGGPGLMDKGYDPSAKGADLLVTWLYRLTTEENNYKLAAVIGILSFVVSAVFSLIIYNKSSAVKGEENFQ